MSCNKRVGEQIWLYRYSLNSLSGWITSALDFNKNNIQIDLAENQKPKPKSA